MAALRFRALLLEMQTENFEKRPRKGLATAAFTFGLISLLDFAWTAWQYVRATPCGKDFLSNHSSFLSLIAILLGVTAFRKGRSESGGNWLSIFGVIISLPAFLLSVANVKSCNFQESRGLGREVGAMKSLQTIHQNQSQYLEMNGRLGTLSDLYKAGLIDEAYASGQIVAGYIYTSIEVSADTYCVQASRANAKCGYRNFIVCEDGVLRYSESDQVRPLSRGEGTPLSSVATQTTRPAAVL